MTFISTGTLNSDSCSLAPTLIFILPTISVITTDSACIDTMYSDNCSIDDAFSMSR